MDDILIGNGGIIIEPQTPYKSKLSKQNDAIELLIKQAIQFAVERAEPNIPAIV